MTPRLPLPSCRFFHRWGAGLVFLGLSTFGAASPDESTGAVSLPAGTIPFSDLSSEEAHKQFGELLLHPSSPPAGTSLEETRRFYDKFNTNLVDRMRKRYAVTIQTQTMGGVVTDVITPAQGISSNNRTRVLINLHGGAFMWGARSGGWVESIPIAAVGRIKVVTVDYREAPEHQFPAAGDDVASVFAALLKDYKARNIGIYGCSAGGFLTAESVAAFRSKILPAPGAIGTFCASLIDVTGDSSFVAPLLGGQPFPGKPLSILDLPYFKGVNPANAMVFPGRSNDVLRRFPPTLLITGTRDFAMSSVVRSHALLTDAGVDAELHVYEGMWHAFFIYPELPESMAAYDVIVRFFDRHLGR